MGQPRRRRLVAPITAEGSAATGLSLFGLSLDVFGSVNANVHFNLELLLADHIHGVPAVIAADQERGTLTVQFAKVLQGPFNRAAILRATLLENGQPVIAEALVDVLSEKKR